MKGAVCQTTASLTTMSMTSSTRKSLLLVVPLLLGLVVLLSPSGVDGYHHREPVSGVLQHRHRHHHHDERWPIHEDENAVQDTSFEDYDEHSQKRHDNEDGMRKWSRHTGPQRRHEHVGKSHRHSSHHHRGDRFTPRREEEEIEVDVDDPRWHRVQQQWRKDREEDEEKEPFGKQYSRRKSSLKSRPRSRHDWPSHRFDDEDNEAEVEIEEDEEDNYARKLPKKLLPSPKLNDWLERTRPETTSARIENELVRDSDDEEEIWSDVEQDTELDNDFYENDEPMIESRPPLKTYDDIIKRLTEDEPEQSSKRGYRKIEERSQRDPYPVRETLPSHNRVLKFVDGSLAAAESRTHTGKGHSFGAETSTNADYVDDEERRSHRQNLVEDERETSTSAPTTTTKPSTTTTTTPRTTLTPTTTPTTTSTTTTTTTTTTTMTPTTKWQEQQSAKESRPRHVQDTGVSGVGGSDEPVSIGQYSPGYEVKNERETVRPSAQKQQHQQQSHHSRDSPKEHRGGAGAASHSAKDAKAAAERHAAHMHALHVAKEGDCHWPRAKVIPVRDIYPNSTATYTPHCVILHRCSDDTGCCKSETLTCEAKTTQRVEFYFYASYVDSPNKVEKLSFENHTECVCGERRDSMQSDMRPMEQRIVRTYHGPQNVVRPAIRKTCRCSSQFSPIITEDGVCECICIEQHQDCLKLQSGKGYLSLVDRICIKTEQCTAPKCKFGEFIPVQGKCPKKKDVYWGQLPSNANLRQPSNHYYPQRRS